MDTMQAKFRSWRRWSWDEIYIALRHEGGQGGAFEVERELIDDPVSSGAQRETDAGWDYRFTGNDGTHLYVQDLGDRYAAFLQDSSSPVIWAPETRREISPALAAAWGGFLVFLGSLWAVLEATFTRV